MEVPKVFFQNTEFKNPLESVIVLTEACIKTKRGIFKKTIHDEIIHYIEKEIKFIGRVTFGESWLLDKVFSVRHIANQQASAMVGVFDRHSRTSLFHFARDISEIIYQRGFKEEIVEYFIAKLVSEIPKTLSKKYKVVKNEHEFIIKRK